MSRAEMNRGWQVSLLQVSLIKNTYSFEYIPKSDIVKSCDKYISIFFRNTYADFYSSCL